MAVQISSPHESTGGQAVNDFIAEGDSAQVFRVSAGAVIKLFKPHITESLADSEYLSAQVAHGAGLPVAEPLGREQREGRQAICFEYLAGESLVDAMGARPTQMFALLGRMARLHALMHRQKVDGRLRSQTGILAIDIEHGPSAAALKAPLLKLLKGMTPGDRLCHGDFHPGNVMVTPQGLSVVDWAKAAAGHPAADVARTELLIRFGPLKGVPERSQAVRFTRWLAARFYVHSYLKASGMAKADIALWRLPVATAWLRARKPSPGDAFEKFFSRLAARPGR